jgi:hypothetical protein
MEWHEIAVETNEGQTSFIKPAGFPDIPGASNVAIYYDGRKLPRNSYTIECEGALVVVRAPWPEGVEIVVVYTVFIGEK